MHFPKLNLKKGEVKELDAILEQLSEVAENRQRLVSSAFNKSELKGWEVRDRLGREFSELRSHVIKLEFNYFEHPEDRSCIEQIQPLKQTVEEYLQRVGYKEEQA